MTPPVYPDSMDPFKIEVVRTEEGERTLRLSGPFTLSSIFDFQSVTRSDDSSITIIDLAGVPYMDSAALGSLMGLHSSCQKLSEKYALVGVPDRLRTLFAVAGVENILITYPSVREARNALIGRAACYHR